MNSLIFKKIELSRATDEELSSVRSLDRTYFPFPWSSDNWKSSLENSPRYQLSLALVNQVVVGFSIFLSIKIPSHCINSKSCVESISSCLKALPIANPAKGNGLDFIARI